MIFTLEDAMTLALLAHKGQKDMGGEPYILHPERVAFAQKTITGKKVGWLHDTVEDSKGKVTFELLETMNCPEEVLDPVKLLTKQKDQPYEDMVKAIKMNEIATLVKIADLEDNMMITRIRGRREGMINAKDVDRLNKYLKSWSLLTGK